MNRREAERLNYQQDTLCNLGFTRDEAESLRRISMTLRRWHELECGTDNGCVERDEETGKAYWRNAINDRRYPTYDREKGALKRLAVIVGQRNGRPAIVDGRLNAAPAAKLTTYIQTDPRGAALYIIRPGDVPEGANVDSCYPRGVCVY